MAVSDNPDRESTIQLPDFLQLNFGRQYTFPHTERGHLLQRETVCQIGSESRRNMKFRIQSQFYFPESMPHRIAFTRFGRQLQFFSQFRFVSEKIRGNSIPIRSLELSGFAEIKSPISDNGRYTLSARSNSSLLYCFAEASLI